VHINWKKYLSDYNWKGFLVRILLLSFAYYFRSQMEWRSIEQVIMDTVIYSILGIGFLITVLKPDFFIKKPMKSVDKWMVRILGVVWVAILIWLINIAWEGYYMHLLIGK